jgi:hypothetical protein
MKKRIYEKNEGRDNRIHFIKINALQPNHDGAEKTGMYGKNKINN